MPSIGRPVASMGAAAAGWMPPKILGYWPRAHVACAVIFLVVAARVTELLPVLSPFRPVFTTTIIAVALLWQRSSTNIRAAAFADPRMKVVYAYFGWIVVAMIVGVNRTAGMVIVQQLPWALIVLLAFGFCEPGTMQLRRMLAWLTAAITLAAIVGSTLGVQQDGGRLGTGGTLDPNDFAALVALGVPLAVGGMSRARGRQRLVYLVAALLMVAVIAKTGSRGGLLAFIASMLVFAAGFKIQRAIGTAAILLVLGAGLFVAGPPVFRERARSILAPEKDYNTTSEVGRVEIWKRASKVIVMHPVFGVGPNCFALADGSARLDMGRTSAWLTVHDLYLQAFAELGFPGGILLLVILTGATKVTLSCWRRSDVSSDDRHFPELFAMIVAFLVAVVFLSHAYSYVLFAVTGLCAFAARSLSVSRSPASSSILRLPN